ncbi:MAG: hypothetical protein ACQSGP_16115 [Frankia sp.]
MNVAHLIAQLSACDPNTEVRCAVQPTWPFEYHLASAQEVTIRDGDPCVYLVVGEQLDYLPRKVAEEIGWTRRRAY